jgi:hypothetical protein
MPLGIAGVAETAPRFNAATLAAARFLAAFVSALDGDAAPSAKTRVAAPNIRQAAMNPDVNDLNCDMGESPTAGQEALDVVDS